MKTLTEICKTYNLRRKLDEDRQVIAHTRSRKFPLDHIYEGFENCYGVAIGCRGTRQRFNNVCHKLIALGATLYQRGDTEGNFKIKEESIAEVAKILKIKKTAGKGGSNWVKKDCEVDE